MKIAVLMVFGVASFALGQPASSTEPPAVLQSQVSFQFERVGVPVPRYSLEIHEDGTGRYQADEAASVPSQSSSAAQYMGGKHIDRAITVSPATVAKIFKQARSLDHFNIACESKAKNVANTGKKTLSYVGLDGRGSCVYNYSDNKNVAALSDMFLAIAFTMDEGRRLEFFHRYDRLGLDAVSLRQLVVLERLRLGLGPGRQLRFWRMGFSGRRVRDQHYSATARLSLPGAADPRPKRWSSDCCG